MARQLRYSKFADQIDLDEVYSALGFSPDQEDHRGNDIGQCILPWNLHQHGDTTGKFAIHRQKKVFNCWVCGGGSLLSLVMAVKDLSDEEATDWLYQYTKPAEERGEAFLQRISDIMRPEKDDKPGAPFYNERVLDKWLTDDHPWLEERGIAPIVARWCRVGFNEKHRKYAPKKNGVPIDEPFIGPAIILPHIFKGKLQGWQIRWLTDERPKWAKKYDNTGDFPKSYTVWGYDMAIKSPMPPVVVESVPTAMFIMSQGYPAVATFGASVNEAQIKILRSFQQGVRLAPDKGSAGEEAYWKAAGQLQKYIPVAWIDPAEELQDKEDLGDLVSNPMRVGNLIETAPWLYAKVN